ncbi:hypothetical protein HNR62_001440 [Oceanisphaera litoralis]|uniref:hypothetical protein n=1 Tax=Oceanisphaera litoralis TaxID=225144 RepID=UPI00195DE0A6|nr:hypothetical protein [Oceanisphaera litoralis]MBM7455568.1 hypothetical protein [Oceanisphaera litoralis]
MRVECQKLWGSLRVSREYNKKSDAFFLRSVYSQPANTTFNYTTLIKNNNRNIFNTVYPGIKTGRVIRGFLEYDFNGIKYISRVSSSFKKTVICFSSLPVKGEEQKYKFIKTISSHPVNFIFALDKQAPAEFNSGTYYLDSDSGTEYLDNLQHLIDEIFKNNKQDSFLLVGSSKAASAALIFGLLKGYKNLLISAPQIRIGEYIKKRAKYIFNYFNSKGKQQLDDVILNLAKKQKPTDMNLTITCGIDDDWHLHELELIENTGLEIQKIVTLGSHNEGAPQDYNKILSRYLSFSNGLSNFPSTKNLELEWEVNSSYIVSEDKVSIACFASRTSTTPDARQLWACYLYHGDKINKAMYQRSNTFIFSINTNQKLKYQVFLKDKMTNEKTISKTFHI